jgi:hypothetical protein
MDGVCSNMFYDCCGDENLGVGYISGIAVIIRCQLGCLEY